MLGEPSQVDRCGAAFGAEIVPDGAFLAVTSPGMPPSQGQSLRIPRDRILIETSAARTRFVKEYPENLEDALSIARLSSLAAPVEEGAPEPSTYGFNLHLVYEQDSGESATLYLARRLLSYHKVSYENWTPYGGSGRLVFDDGPRRWTIKLEPRFQDENTPLVFLDMNLHVAVAGFPDDGETARWMTNLWARAHALIESLDNE